MFVKLSKEHALELLTKDSVALETDASMWVRIYKSDIPNKRGRRFFLQICRLSDGSNENGDFFEYECEIVKIDDIRSAYSFRKSNLDYAQSEKGFCQLSYFFWV